MLKSQRMDLLNTRKGSQQMKAELVEGSALEDWVLFINLISQIYFFPEKLFLEEEIDKVTKGI